MTKRPNPLDINFTSIALTVEERALIWTGLLIGSERLSAAQVTVGSHHSLFFAWGYFSVLVK